MINEKDIFDFVFQPKKLDNKVIDKIRSTDIYDDLINYYESLKDFDKNELDQTQKDKISAMIPEYREQKKIILYQVNYGIEQVKSTRFAAATNEKGSQLNDLTYKDNENRFIIRLNQIEEKTKIYLFSKSETSIDNITLEVGEAKKIEINNINEPIVINKIVAPEKIILCIER